MDGQTQLVASISSESPEESREKLTQERALEELENMHESDSDGEKFAELHAAIERGDLVSVHCIVESHEEEQLFSFYGTSALYKAFQCKKHEIISFLIHKGAKFCGNEDGDVYCLDIDLDRVNHHLFDYSRRSDNSCIYKLMYISRSPQVLVGERLNAIRLMYECLFESDLIKLLLKVLENVDFDIVFDFESDKINRVYRLCKEEVEVYGLTLTTAREIFVGAQNLLSKDLKRRAKVYGVVAEQLCHMALTILFKNNAKPYREDDSWLIHKFIKIVRSVASLKDRSCHVESVIKDVYDCGRDEWECELIARVPMVIGIYGEESGMKKFRETSELYRLLIFYESKVLPRCRKYVDMFLNSKSDRIMKQLTGNVEFISFKEKRIQPLMEDFPSFREYAVVEEGVSVISTNCIKLCTLHVYHEMKQVYGDQLDRKCLFFGSEHFEKKRDLILNALKCQLIDNLILILDDKELHYQILEWEYLDYFKEFMDNGSYVLIISNSKFLGTEFEDNFVVYKWNDLTDEYKDFRTRPVEYIFKRDIRNIYVKKEDVLRLFSEEDIIQIISGDVVEVRDGVDLNCQGYNPETYIERQFQAIVIDRNIFKRFPEDTIILIYGLQEWECKEYSINESWVQWLEGPNDEIQKGKVIFICNYKFTMNFKDFVRKTTVKNRICLKYDRKMFYLVNCVGDVCKYHEKKIRQTEEEMIDWLKNSRMLIISDNAGSGKSTVMSRLIWRVKKHFHNSWVLRVDLNAIEDESPYYEEEKLEDIFLMLGFKNGFQKCHFMEFAEQGRCFIFLDSFDKIPMKSKNRALELLSKLRVETRVRVIISTRKQHQQELEQLLNTFSFNLVPLSRENQGRYLEKLWRWKLKYPHGETSKRDEKDIPVKIKRIIEELREEKTVLGPKHHDLILQLENIDFERSLEFLRSHLEGLRLYELGEQVLEKAILGERSLELMGLLQFLGNVHFHCNFDVEIQCDIYCIYSHFIEQEIMMYVEEKGLVHDSILKDKVVCMVREGVFRILLKFADELLCTGKVCFRGLWEDLELCSDLGLVFVHGEEVQFLEQDIAEFFISESIRQNVKKDVFVEILFDDKHNGIRRFLSSSLKKKNFENLKEEFFIELGFLIMRRIVDVDFEFNLDCLKIVKKLLENYEVIVEDDLLIKLIDQIDGLLTERIDGNPKSCGKDSHYIGGCLTVHILKVLLSRQFKFKTVVIHSLVRFSECPREVIDVMEEFISVRTEDVLREREEKTASQSILELLRLKGSDGEGLLYHALRNQRVETFAQLMKFFRNVMGNEQFVVQIIQSCDYRDQMEKFISESHLNIICCSFEALHFVFGDDIGILFNTHLKCKVIEKSLEIDIAAGGLNKLEEPTIYFQTAMSFFHKCLGLELFKEFLICSNCDNDCLVHGLLWRYSTEIINECLTQIEKVLEDRCIMKRLLKSKDVDCRNIFHLSAQRNMHLNGLLQHCDTNLEIDEIMEMLLSADKGGISAMRCLMSKNSCGADEWFNQFLKRKDRNSRSILHFTSMKDELINDSLQFCKAHLQEDEIQEMFFSRDDYGNNVIHLLAMHNSPETLKENLSLIKDFLPDEDPSSQKTHSFKKLLKEKSRDLKNICHYAAMNPISPVNFSIFNLYLNQTEIMDLLRAVDEKGQTCVHIAAYHLRNFCSLLDYADERFQYDRSRFKKLIKKKSKCGSTLFHYLGQCYWGCNVFVFIPEIFSLVKEKLESHDDYMELLRVRNKSGETFLQTDCEIRDDIIECCEDILEKSLFEELTSQEQ